MGPDFPWYDPVDSPAALLYRPGSTAVEADSSEHTVGWASDGSGVGMQRAANASTVVARSLDFERAEAEFLRFAATNLGSTTNLAQTIQCDASAPCGNASIYGRESCGHARFTTSGGAYYGYVGACPRDGFTAADLSTVAAASFGTINMTYNGESEVRLPSLVLTIEDLFGMPTRQPLSPLLPRPPTAAQFSRWSSVFATVELLPDPSWIPVGVWDSYQRLRHASRSQQLLTRQLVTSKVFPVPPIDDVANPPAVDVQTGIPNGLHLGNFTYLFQPNRSKVIVRGLKLIKPRTGTYTLKIKVYNAPMAGNRSVAPTVPIPGVFDCIPPCSRASYLATYIRFLVYPAPRAAFVKMLTGPKTFNPYFPLNPQPQFILRDASGNRVDVSDVNTSLATAFVSHVTLTSGTSIRMYPVGTEQLPNGTLVGPEGQFYVPLLQSQLEASFPPVVGARGASQRSAYISLLGSNSLGILRGIVGFDSLQVKLGPSAHPIQEIQSVTLRFSVLNRPANIVGRFATSDIIGVSLTIEASRFCTLPPTSSMVADPRSVLYEQALNRSRGGYPLAATTQGYTDSGLLEIKLVTVAAYRSTFLRFYTSQARSDALLRGQPNSSTPRPLALCQYGFDRSSGETLDGYPMMQNSTDDAIQRIINGSQPSPLVSSGIFLGEAEIVDDCLLVCRFNISNWGSPVAALWQFLSAASATSTTTRRRAASNFSKSFLNPVLRREWSYFPSVGTTYFPPPARIGTLPPVNPYFPDAAPLVLHEVYHPSIVPENPLMMPRGTAPSDSSPVSTYSTLVTTTSPTPGGPATPVAPFLFSFLSDRGFALRPHFSDPTILSVPLDPFGGTLLDEIAVSLVTSRGMNVAFTSPLGSNVSFDPRSIPLARPVNATVITALLGSQSVGTITRTNQIVVSSGSTAVVLAGNLLGELDPVAGVATFDYLNIIGFPQPSNYSLTFVGLVATNPGCVDWGTGSSAACAVTTIQDVSDVRVVRGVLRYKLSYVSGSVCKPQPVVYAAVPDNDPSEGVDGVSLTYCKGQFITALPNQDLNFTVSTKCTTLIPSRFLIRGFYFEFTGARVFVGPNECTDVEHNASNPVNVLTANCKVITGNWTVKVVTTQQMVGESAIPLVQSNPPIFIDYITGCPKVDWNSTALCSSQSTTVVTIHGSEFGTSASALKITMVQRVPTQYPPPKPLACYNITLLSSGVLTCTIPAAVGASYQFTIFNSATMERSNASGRPLLPPAVNYASASGYLCEIDDNGFLCFNRGTCNFNTGICTCFVSTVGHWTGAGCGECISGYYGVNCSNVCPTCVSGTCNDGMYGNGACSCITGYWGTLCDRDCPGGADAPCRNHGTCYPQNGTCLCYSSPTAGYWADSSCSTCNSFYSGADCTTPCPVFDGLPCSGHGTCLNGQCACNTNYCDTNCNVSFAGCEGCDAGLWGLACNNTCPGGNGSLACSNHGVCSDGPFGNGLCSCDAGYGGTSCNVTCPPNATNPCSGNGLCSQQVGTCTCNYGYATKDCSVVCPGGVDSVCSGRGRCDIDTGTCICRSGYSGAACNVECPGGASRPCNLHGDCVQASSTCSCYQNKTAGFWTGTACTTCSADWWGSSCREQCNFVNGSQCAGHGKCTMAVTCSCYRSSQIGFWTGVNCTECVDGYYGSSCTSECPGTACNSCSLHGICRQGVAGNGTCGCYRDGINGYWDNSFCSDCLYGYYGESCSNRCPIGVGNSVCSNRGTCDGGISGSGSCSCSNTWGGTACQGCATGFWGTNCSNKCPGPIGQPCFSRGYCNNSIYSSGKCKCDEGYGGSDCSLECPRGPYGVCNNKGTCALNTLGTAMTCINCYVGSDTGYWKGTACSDCVSGYYGPQCSSECPGGANSPCNNAGKCSDGYSGTGGCKCMYGYSGLSCTRECVGGALLPCSGHGSCDTTTGACTCYADAARGFWTGSNCSACYTNYTGSTCTKLCPVSNGAICSGRGTCYEGTCIACSTGYCGTACHQTSGCVSCATYRYGPQCTACPGGTSKPCNNNGVCLWGSWNTGSCICSSSYRGTSCSLRCPGPDNIPCFGRGNCSTVDATCTCNSGYAGSNCSITCKGYSLLTGNPACNGRGACNPIDGSCSCQYGYGGLACEVACPSTNASFAPCDGHGVCSTQGTCTCDATNPTGYWGGASCSRCAEGYFGADCKSKCVNGVSNAAFTGCACNQYWSGPACNISCPGLSEGTVCYGHGNCSWGESMSSTCTCFETWFNATCQKFCTVAICNAALTNGQCNVNTGFCECQFNTAGHWAVSATGQCDTCDPNYYGENCELECKCNGHGLCDRRTGTCTCYESDENGFWGNKFCDVCLDGYVGVQCKGLNVKISPLGTYGAPVSVPSLDYLRGLMCYDEDYGWSIFGTDPIVVAHSDTGVSVNVITTSGWALECAFKNALEVYILVFRTSQNALLVLNRQTGSLLRTEYVQRVPVPSTASSTRVFQPMRSTFGSNRHAKLPGVFLHKPSLGESVVFDGNTDQNVSTAPLIYTTNEEEGVAISERLSAIEPLKYQHQRELNELMRRQYVDDGDASVQPALLNSDALQASRAFRQLATSVVTGQEVLDSQMLPPVQGATADLLITPYQFGTLTFIQLAAGLVSTATVGFLGRPIHVRDIATATSSSSATASALLITTISPVDPAVWEIAIASSAFPSSPGLPIAVSARFYTRFNSAIQALCGGSCLPVQASANSEIVIAAFLSATSTYLVKMPILGNATGDLFAVQIMLESVVIVTGLELDDYSNRGYIASHSSGTPTLISKFDMSTAVVSGTISLSVVGADREIAIRMTGRTKQRVLDMLTPISGNQRITKLAMFAVSRLDPTLADTKGGTLITLVGEGMISGMSCDFGGRTAAASFINSSAVVCLSPAGGTESCQGEAVEAVISVAGKTANKNYLKRVASAVVRKITNNVTSTNIGFVNGSFLEVEGSGFTTCDTCIYDLLKCKLYSPTTVTDNQGNEITEQIIVPATYVTSGLVRCNLPPVSSPLPIPSYLEVTVDGTVYSESLAEFSILGEASQLVVLLPTDTPDVKSNETSVVPTISVAVADSVGHPLMLFLSSRNTHVMNVSVVANKADSTISMQVVLGATQITDTDGIANFTDVYIHHPLVGTLLLLVEDIHRGWRHVVAFNVVEGEPNSMYFVRYPSVQTSNSAPTLATQPIVGLLDVSGNAISTLANKQRRVDFITAFYEYFDLQDNLLNRTISIAVSDAQFKVEGIAITGLRERNYYIVFTADSLPKPVLVSPAITVELCESTQYAVRDSTACQTCPSNAKCDGSYTLAADDGWWRADNTTLNFYSCSPPYGANACRNDSSCLPGYTGPRCSTCTAGYGRAYMKCVKCDTSWTSFVILGAIAVLLLGVLSLLIVTVSLSNYNESLPVVFRNFVTHVQILSRLGDLLIPWPDVLTNLWQTFARFSTLEAVDISPLDCALQLDYYGKYSLLLASPWALTICCFPIVCGVLLYYRRSNEYLDRAVVVAANCRYNEASELLRRIASTDYEEAEKNAHLKLSNSKADAKMDKKPISALAFFVKDRLDPLSIDPAPRTYAPQTIQYVREFDPATGKFRITAVDAEKAEPTGYTVRPRSGNPLSVVRARSSEGSNFEVVHEDEASGEHLWSPVENGSEAPRSVQVNDLEEIDVDSQEASFEYFALSSPGIAGRLGVNRADPTFEDLDAEGGESSIRPKLSVADRQHTISSTRPTTSSSASMSLDASHFKDSFGGNGTLRSLHELGDEDMLEVTINTLRDLMDGRSGTDETSQRTSLPSGSSDGGSEGHRSSLEKTRLWYVLHLTRIAHTLRIMAIRDSRYRPTSILLVTAVTVFSLLYPTLVQSSGQVLRCETLDLGKEGYHSVSVNQRTSLCDSGIHKLYRTIAITSIVAYGALIPLVIVLSVILLTQAVSSGFLVARAVLNFLMAGLKSHLWYWEAVNMMRKFLSMVVIVFISESKLQVIGFMWVVAVGCLLQVNFAPYTHPAIHYLECLGQSCMVVTLNVVLLFFFLYDANLNTDPRWIAMTVVIVALNVVAALAYVVGMAYFLYWKLRALWRSRNDAKERELLAVHSLDVIRGNVAGVGTLRQTKATLVEKVRQLHINLERLEDEEMEQRTAMFGAMSNPSLAGGVEHLSTFTFGGGSQNVASANDMEPDLKIGDATPAEIFGGWTFPLEGREDSLSQNEHGAASFIHKDGIPTHKAVTFNEFANATTLFGEGMPVSISLARQNRRKRGVNFDPMNDDEAVSNEIGFSGNHEEHAGLGQYTSGSGEEMFQPGWDDSVWVDPQLKPTASRTGHPTHNHDWLENIRNDESAQFLPHESQVSDYDGDGMETLRQQTRDALRLQFGSSSDSSSSVSPVITPREVSSSPAGAQKQPHPNALTETALKRHLRATERRRLSHSDARDSSSHKADDEPFDYFSGFDAGGIAPGAGGFLSNLVADMGEDGILHNEAKQNAIRTWVPLETTNPPEHLTSQSIDLADSSIFEPGFMPVPNHGSDDVEGSVGDHPLEATEGADAHIAPSTLSILNPTGGPTPPPRAKAPLVQQLVEPLHIFMSPIGGENEGSPAAGPAASRGIYSGSDLDGSIFGGPLEFDVWPSAPSRANREIVLEVTSPHQATNPWSTGTSVASPHIAKTGIVTRQPSVPGVDQAAGQRFSVGQFGDDSLDSDPAQGRAASPTGLNREADPPSFYNRVPFGGDAHFNKAPSSGGRESDDSVNELVVRPGWAAINVQQPPGGPDVDWSGFNIDLAAVLEHEQAANSAHHHPAAHTSQHVRGEAENRGIESSTAATPVVLPHVPRKEKKSSAVDVAEKRSKGRRKMKKRTFESDDNVRETDSSSALHLESKRRGKRADKGLLKERKKRKVDAAKHKQNGGDPVANPLTVPLSLAGRANPFGIVYHDDGGGETSSDSYF